MESVPDSIEKNIHLRAPRSRVWRAISDAQQFGAWFGVVFDAPFAPGRRIQGRITPTTVDPEVAKLQEPHAGMPFAVTVEQMEPERLFSFRWSPGGGEADAPTTLVTFELEEAAGGTRLRLTESGYSKIPLERRAALFTGNDEGWSHQMRLIEKYLALHA